MKKSLQVTKILGVTLLEIMLVLAIAAMVLVMSVRYYQSASTSQKINAALGTVANVVAAGENYQASAGSYSSISNAALVYYMPNGAMPTSPWSTTLTVTAVDAVSYTITITAVPNAACVPLKSLLLQNKKLTSTTTCGTAFAATTDLLVTVSQ